ncbi:hypothetical protein JL101_030010 (plasmid) [Skermanella rosea]|uniref:hypothetical protein n=1 Tax=Skermanella rosea TaxID=1817965 RepID=UPI001932FC29|nr:hypothetical protein [Skermanella rosea]UEM07220.1 hypothetical protein JL101_030010 [Skermanella rosea]
MAYRLTCTQRRLLADGVRAGLVGWLLTCPVAGRHCLLLRVRSTTILGFSFSRFVTAAANHFGRDYHPRSPGAAGTFPLSIEEACALANDVELEMATGEEIQAAALVVAHAPFAQPGIGGPDWHPYTTMLDRLGIDILDGDPAWKNRVRDCLRAFRRHVAAVHAAAE